MAFILIQYLLTCLCTAKCQATLSVMVRGEKKRSVYPKTMAICYFNKPRDGSTKIRRQWRFLAVIDVIQCIKAETENTVTLDLRSLYTGETNEHSSSETDHFHLHHR